MAGDSGVMFIIRADTKTAQMALRDLSYSADRTGETIKRSSRESATAYEHLGKTTIALREKVSSLAGIVGFTGLAFGLKDAIAGGEQLQASQAQLRTALQSTGGSVTQLTNAARTLSEHGGFSTVQNIQALTAFTRETRSATEAQKLLTLATDIARGRNMDLATSQMVVQRAAGGSIGRLQALLGPMVAAKEASFGLTQAKKQEFLTLEMESRAMGINGALWLKQQEILHAITPQQAALATLTDKHATATMVLAAAQRAFGNATDTYSKTTQGRISNLTNTFKNLVDELGQALLPTVNRVVSVIEVLVNWLNKNRIVMAVLMGTIAGVTAVLAAHAAITEIAKAKTIAFTAVQKVLGITAGETAAAEGEATVATIAWGDAMKLTIAGAIITALVLLATHFQQVRTIAVEVWHAITQGATAAWHWIEHAADGIYHAITSAFRKASNFVLHDTPLGGLFQLGRGIGSGNILGGLGGLARGLSFGLLSSGGPVKPRYFDMGGPVGSDTIPGWLSPGEGVLNRQGMGLVGEGGLAAINAGVMPGGQTVTYQPYVIQLDGRVLTKAVIRQVLNTAARGPSSLVGGSLVTGAPATWTQG